MVAPPAAKNQHVRPMRLPLLEFLAALLYMVTHASQRSKSRARSHHDHLHKERHSYGTETHTYGTETHTHGTDTHTWDTACWCGPGGTQIHTRTYIHGPVGVYYIYIHAYNT